MLIFVVALAIALQSDPHWRRTCHCIVVLPRPRFYQQGRGVGHDPGVPQLSQLLVVRLAVVTKLGGEDRSQLDKEDLYLYPTWVGCAAAVELQTKVIRRKDFTITEKASTRLLC